MSKTTPLPEGLEFQTIEIQSNSGEVKEAEVAFKKWSEKECNKRAFKKTTKIVGTILACSLIGLFVHILLVVIIQAVFITVIGSFPLYLKFKNENSTIYYAKGQCPGCQFHGNLKPYLDSKLNEEMTLQCPKCGQTMKATLKS